MKENITRRSFVAGIAALATGCVGGPSVDESAPIQERLRQRAAVGMDGVMSSGHTTQVRDTDDGYGVTVSYLLPTAGDKLSVKNALTNVAEAFYTSPDANVVESVEIQASMELVNEYGEKGKYVVGRGRLNADEARRINWDNATIQMVWRHAENKSFREGVM